MKIPNSKRREAIKIPSVASLVDSALTKNAHRATNKEMAEKMGFMQNKNTTYSPAVSLLRTGKMIMPFGRIEASSRALDIDPRILFLATLKDKIIKGKTLEGQNQHDKEMLWIYLYSLIAGIQEEKQRLMQKTLKAAEEELGREVILDDVTLEKIKQVIVNENQL